VNEQELFLRVGELTGRVGYPMPTVNWVKGVVGEPCIRLQETREGTATLTVHDHVDEFHPEEEQDLLITQELVRARVGAFRGLQRLKVAAVISSYVIGAVAALVSHLVGGELWQVLLLSLVFWYLGLTAVKLLMNLVWARRFNRRADLVLVEVVGRERFVAWMTSHADFQPAWFRGWFRWVLSGAPPLPAERLRMLEERPAAG
jgi:hypothetical protein